ncbi:hypothetical protein LOAG_02786 [Loa loa]|uniref:Claspin n=1 Tax=Loa loa TaxID=7209 RepID=A0A1I7W152_LOALO|nr:hypothetical protein LOAG_02786 [Loa loa]EFO25698.1 hypothetical protein LOAG_02786 [Loa loa]
MSTPANAENEAADRENIVASENDTSPPPAKVTKIDRRGSVTCHPRKHLETVCSQGSEGSDEDLSAGDAVKPLSTDSDRSDSPAAESDRITPVPKFEYNDSDSSDEGTQLASDRGDLLKDVENITESSDSSGHSPEHTKHEESCGLHCDRSSPPACGELPESSKGPTTPCSPQADRVTSLRKRMAVYSPSDNILSPCTMKLNRLKNFFRMRQKTRALSLLSAEELSEENDGADDDEVEGIATGEADIPADDEVDKSGDEDIALTESQEGSDHDDI